jgi:hypothetical protein
MEVAMDERLRKVERELWALRVVVVAAVALAVTSGAVPRPGRVECRELAVVGADGSERIVLGTFKDGQPKLLMLDTQGRGRLFLWAGSGGSPVLAMYDERDRPLLRLKVDRGRGTVESGTDPVPAR